MVLCAVVAAAVPALAAEPAISFRGKTIRMIVGASPGGGFDAYSRLVAAHLGKSLPGSPTVIVQNMTGAGALIAANYIANVAPKDGTVIGMVNSGIVTDALFLPDRFKFDSRKVRWIGSALRETHVAIAWHASPLMTFPQVFDREFVVAGSGGSSSTYPVLLNGVLGTRFKVVAGYAGTTEGGLAMERGEVQGIAAITWASLKATQPAALRNRQLRILVQYGMRKHPELMNVPWIYDYVRNDSDRAALDLVLRTQEFGRPFIVADGVSAAMVSVLRAAFDQTMSSAEFRADAARRQLDIDPVSGAEVERIVDQILRTSPSVIDRVRTLLEAVPR
jgi:tripartite-type tricarboxylate transporter receptor subunit TctC